MGRHAHVTKGASSLQPRDTCTSRRHWSAGTPGTGAQTPFARAVYHLLESTRSQPCIPHLIFPITTPSRLLKPHVKLARGHLNYLYVPIPTTPHVGF